MAKAKIQPTVTIEEAPKSNKAAKVIQLRGDNPTMTNVSVANKVGCSQTYSSKIWSDHMKATGKATKARRTAKNAPATKEKSQKVTAKRKATTTNSSASGLPATTSAILNARRDMACIVDRLGASAAQALLSDVTST